MNERRFFSEFDNSVELLDDDLRALRVREGWRVQDTGQPLGD